MDNFGVIAYKYIIITNLNRYTKWAYKVCLENKVYNFYYKNNIVYSVKSDNVEQINIEESRFEKI